MPSDPYKPVKDMNVHGMSQPLGETIEVLYSLRKKLVNLFKKKKNASFCLIRRTMID